VDAPGQLAELAERVLGALVSGIDQLAGRLGVRHLAAVTEFLLRHAEVHGERREPDLGAIMQVAFQAPELRGRVVDRQRPSLLEVLEPLRDGSGAEQAADQPPVDSHDGPGDPRSGEQHARACSEGGERAGKGRDAEMPVPEPVERRDDRDRAQLRARRMVAERLPPERVGQVDQPGTPEDGDGVTLEQRDRQLQEQVGDRPPAGAVAEPDVEPAEQVLPWRRWRRRRNRFAEQPARQAPTGRGEAPGGAGRHHQHGQQRGHRSRGQYRPPGRIPPADPGRPGRQQREADRDDESRQRQENTERQAENAE
jgi:hypothetical protein